MSESDRGSTDVSPKGSGKVSLMNVATGEGNLSDRQIGFGKQEPGVFHPQASEILVWSSSEALLKSACEVELAYTGFSGKRVELYLP